MADFLQNRIVQKRWRMLPMLLYFMLFAEISFAQVRADSVFRKSLEESFNIRFSDNNRFVVFKSGTEKFEDMFKAIAQARKSVHLEYFNFRNDSISNLLFELLAERVEQGVEVRVLVDDFGNLSNDRPLRKKHLRKIRESGIKIHRYNAIKFPYVNHIFRRDHRKIVVIDGMIGYTGGMNVADYYVVGKPELGAWRDFHARLEGEVVNDLQREFIQIWNFSTGENLSGAQYYTGYKEVKDYFYDLAQNNDSTNGQKVIGLVSKGPFSPRNMIHKAFVQGIRSANTEITLMNPYFTLCRHVRKEFRKALKRGVRLNILVSAKSDIPITPRVVEHNVHRLMKRGANVYFYADGFQHGKVMMVDSLYTFMGSANLDSRSLWHDFECNVAVCDSVTTQFFLQQFQNDKENAAWQLTPETWNSHFSKKKRRGAWFWQFLWPFL
ncbi:MAG: cardiolipin synthase [Alloprevotella sp.]|nr:cardiolipin synthase [Alloprevotella sp.]